MSRYTPANKLIGERVRFAREDQGMTQRRLGEMVGITGKRIGEYENGRVTLPAPLAAMLAHRLGHTVDSFLPGNVITEAMRSRRR